MQKQSLHPAFRIPLPDNRGNNCLSLGYTEMIVRVCNAFLSIPGLQISDNNAKLLAEAIAAGGSGAIPGLPWQISSVSDGVIQVSAGYVFVDVVPGSTSIPSTLRFDPDGTGVNITLPGTPGVYPVWLECIPGAFLAYVKTEATDTFPTTAVWPNSPAPFGFDNDWVTPYANGYVLLGEVDTTVSPNVITQYVFDNPVLIDYTGDKRASYSAPWSGGGKYRNGTILSYSGHIYVRNGLIFGDNGGTPGSGSTDWALML